MSSPKGAKARAGRELLDEVAVAGVKAITTATSTLERVCDSEACAAPRIGLGEAYLRVVYDPDDGRWPEFFHDVCFWWEFT